MVAVSSSPTASASRTGAAAPKSASLAPPSRRTAMACFRLGEGAGAGNAVGEVEFVDDDLRCAILDDVAVLGQRVTDVERNRHRAEPRYGEQHDDKLDAVAEHHGDAIALLDPKRPQAARGLPTERVELGVAQSLLVADEREPVRTARDRVRQHLVHASRAARRSSGSSGAP